VPPGGDASFPFVIARFLAQFRRESCEGFSDRSSAHECRDRRVHVVCLCECRPFFVGAFPHIKDMFAPLSLSSSSGATSASLRERSETLTTTRRMSSSLSLPKSRRWTTLTRARIEKKRKTLRAKSNHLAATASSSSSSSSSSPVHPKRRHRNKSAASCFGDTNVHQTMGEASSKWMSSSLSSSIKDSHWGQKRTKIVPRNSNRLDHGKGGGGGFEGTSGNVSGSSSASGHDGAGVSYDISNDESDFLQQAGMLDGKEKSASLSSLDIAAEKTNGTTISRDHSSSEFEEDENCDPEEDRKNRVGGGGCCNHSHGGALAVDEDVNRARNKVEVVVDVVLTKSKLNAAAGYLRGRGSLTVLSWCLLLVAGFCHVSTSICAMLNVASIVPGATAAWLSTSATALVYLFAGTPEFVDVLYEVARGNINVHVLTTLAVFGTVLLGCAFEGALLLVLFASAHYVEDRLTQHARGDLKALWKTVPPFANVVDIDGATGDPIEGSQRKMRASEVPVGSYCYVKAGTQVPLDGIVVHGSARVSIQHITGEALPVRRRIGDEIPAGAMNIDGVLILKSSQSSENSTPARIAKLTERAQQRKPRVSRLIDDVGDKYSRIILFITFATMVTAPLVFGVPFLGRGGAMYRSFAFLSAAAPCALLMSPLVYVAAIGAMARRGILIRGGRTLDALANVNLVCLDKTGTLTLGEMSIVEIKTVELSEESIASLAFKRSDEESVRVAKALERGSVHPIAKATVNYIGNGDNSSASRSSLDVKNYKVEHGKGVEGEINGEVFRFGTASWALECRRGNNSSEEEKVVARATEEHRSAGEAIAVLCSSSSPDATVFRYSDAPRAEAKDAVDTLRKRGQTVRMLTGDATASALAIAEQVGIEPAAVFSQLTPDKKLAHVESAREDGKKEENGKVVSVAMIGDGINDAPALAAADVGIAVCSTPSDAASSAADVLLLQTGQGQLQSKDTVMSGGSMSVISAVPELFALGRMTRNILQQNIFLAICSILGSALPALFGAFPLWLAVCVHEGATLLVAVNSTRLLATFGPRNSMRLSKRVKFLIVTLTLVGIFGALGTVFKPQGVMLQTLISEAVTAAVAESSVAFHSFFHPVLKSAWAGLFAGGLHTLTGADHLAALTPLSVGPSRAKNALLGALWGFGHNTGQIIFGLLFMLLRNRIPWNTEIIGQWGQAIVGLTLIFIGCLGFWEQVGGGHGHSHIHSHGGHSHSHSHSHGSSDDGGESYDEVEQSHEHRLSPLRLGASSEASRISWTYITGTIHGLQPDSLFLLLPALTLPKLEAYSFLGSFFFGTIVAMGGYTAFLGAGTTLLEKENPQMVKYIGLAASSVAFALGAAFVLSSVFSLNWL
jgi:Zn2+/Cd2+-exporting ATPase